MSEEQIGDMINMMPGGEYGLEPRRLLGSSSVCRGGGVMLVAAQASQEDVQGVPGGIHQTILTVGVQSEVPGLALAAAKRERERKSLAR
ncbi:hypothetical protein N1Z41_00035890 [Pseudomonas aeruginosa]